MILFFFNLKLLLLNAEQKAANNNLIVFGSTRPLGQLQPSFGGMVLGWPPSKNMSGDPDFQPRWPLGSAVSEEKI
jgi:hypothetical protein